MTKTNALVTIIVVLVLVTPVAGVLSVIALHDTKNTTTQNCQQIETVKDALRQTLNESKSQVLTSKIRTPAEKLKTTEYYNHVLGLFAPRRCEAGARAAP